MATLQSPLYDIFYVDNLRKRQPLPPPAPRFIAYAKEVGNDEYVIPFVGDWRLATRAEAIQRRTRLRRPRR